MAKGRETSASSRSLDAPEVSLHSSSLPLVRDSQGGTQEEWGWGRRG